ncbi:MAG: hypothetical protein R3E87_21835 [Burkholderiaceae bacterium]
MVTAGSSGVSLREALAAIASQIDALLASSDPFARAMAEDLRRMRVIASSKLRQLETDVDPAPREVRS